MAQSSIAVSAFDILCGALRNYHDHIEHLTIIDGNDVRFYLLFLPQLGVAV